MMLINEKQIPTVHIKLVDNCVNGQGLSVETMSLYISLIRNLPSGPTQYLQNPTRTASRTSFIPTRTGRFRPRRLQNHLF
jgi:hypothetical protein